MSNNEDDDYYEAKEQAELNSMYEDGLREQISMLRDLLQRALNAMDDAEIIGKKFKQEIETALRDTK